MSAAGVCGMIVPIPGPPNHALHTDHALRWTHGGSGDFKFGSRLGSGDTRAAGKRHRSAV